MMRTLGFWNQKSKFLGHIPCEQDLKVATILLKKLNFRYCLIGFLGNTVNVKADICYLEETELCPVAMHI